MRSVPLAALEHAFGPLDATLVMTVQAVSGAGHPGVQSLDNAVPYTGEEDKLKWELKKVLGAMCDDGRPFDLHEQVPLNVSAACNRVPMLEGHTECVSVRFARRPPPCWSKVREVLRRYTCEAQALGCPSVPAEAIVVHDKLDRPQPRMVWDYHDGTDVSVGRVRECLVLDIKFVMLANNVVIGAATSSIIK